MTNNKQQTAVKLYTEGQVQHAIQMARYSQNIFSTPFIYDRHEILEQLKPIELPSDEQIEDASLEENNDDLSPAEEFQSGAKWMRNKIQGGEQ